MLFILLLLSSSPFQVSGGPVAFSACVVDAAGPVCAASAAMGEFQI